MRVPFSLFLPLFIFRRRARARYVLLSAVNGICIGIPLRVNQSRSISFSGQSAIRDDLAKGSVEGEGRGTSSSIKPLEPSEPENGAGGALRAFKGSLSLPSVHALPGASSKIDNVPILNVHR